MALQFFDRTKDGHGLTMGSKLDPLELQRGIKLEEHVQIYEDFLKTTGDGTYGFMGEFKSGASFSAPKAAQMAGDSAQAVARVRLRMQKGEPPQLMGIDPDTGIKIFYEEDNEAYRLGYICENCVQYQAVPNAPICNWLNNPSDGCGHRNHHA
jgi:hypothetical protein